MGFHLPSGSRTAFIYGYRKSDEVKMKSTTGSTWSAASRLASVVADIAVQFFDKNGTKIRSAVDAQIIGLDIDDIKKIPRVIGVAGGSDKTEVLRAALSGGLINVMITDDGVATDLLKD